jgi:hypothetical protein
MYTHPPTHSPVVHVPAPDRLHNRLVAQARV